jgi:RNA polymerase sigma-70 factor (ECF subfamily)
MHAKLTLPIPAATPLMRDDPAALHEIDFESLYRREYPGLFGVANVLVGADAEDLVHDAMLQALVHWGRVRRLDRPGGWCHRVLVNRCRSWWRRRRTREAYIARQRRIEPFTPGPSPETIAFWQAVRTLPDRPRLVVTLHYAGDRPVAEVARILDVPEGTVRSDLTRARGALKRLLEV